MKIEGYEEITEEEYLKDSLGDNLYVHEWMSDKKRWFKKVQKFPRHPDVFIERAALCTIDGIRAICGTDKEYSEYVEKIKKEKAQKSLICFEGEFKTFSVTEDGWLEIRSKEKDRNYLCIKQDIPLLVKAVEKAKEVMNK